MILIHGHLGARYYLSEDKITAFGIDPGPRLFIYCDGREYSTPIEPEKQLEIIMTSIHKEEFEIKGIKLEEK